MSPSSAEFTISVYPHDAMIQDYYSDDPVILAIVASFALLVLVLICFAFDYFVVTNNYEEELTKTLRKAFLRYISHEIRTPLNAVYMGVTVLLQRESADAGHPGTGLSTLNSSTTNGSITGRLPSDTRKQIRSAASVVSTGAVGVTVVPDEDVFEIKRNLESAMVVLDDLVTYVRLSDCDKKTHAYHRAPIICARHLLEESVKSIESTSRQYDTTFVFEEQGPKQDQPTIRGDRVDLMLVLTYMLKFAIKMTISNAPIELEGE
jgi:signal transduction histidine kinase